MKNSNIHVNIPDSKGNVFCYLIGGKLSFKPENMDKVRHQCLNCKFFGGTAQGQGVECVYPDKKDKTA